MPFDPFTAALDISGIGFTGNPLDRADALRTDAAKVSDMREDNGARFLAFQDLKPLLDASSGSLQLLWQSRADIVSDTDISQAVFLGLSGEIPHFAAAVAADMSLPGRAIDARAAAAQMADADSAVVGQGRALLSWHSTHLHCARCGAPTAMTKAGYARQCTNPDCKADHFPRTDPVVIMLIVDGDRCLLGRQPQFPARFFSALAGFIEPGETMEEAVARETWEEAGIRCGRVRYVASQPWPFPSSLMIGSFAEATSFDIQIDKTELEEARWFSRSEVLAAMGGNGSFLMPPPLALAHHLVKAWAQLG
jgi:NAD+ diphosphatase